MYVGQPEVPAGVAVGEAFVVDAQGRIQNADMGQDAARLGQRLTMLEAVEDSFIKSNRGEIGKAHKDIYIKARDLMTSTQMAAFRVEQERPESQA